MIQRVTLFGLILAGLSLAADEPGWVGRQVIIRDQAALKLDSPIRKSTTNSGSTRLSRSRTIPC